MPEALLRLLAVSRFSCWATQVRNISKPSVLGVALLFGNSSCLGVRCDRNVGEPVRYTEGRTLASGTYYETGDWDEPFLHFPAGRSYDLVHELESHPGDFEAYLAFSPCPLSSSIPNPGGRPRCAPVNEESGGPGMAESAGNQVIFHVREPGILRVRNDTCAEFYLRIVARSPNDGETTPADAGSSNDAGAVIDADAGVSM